MIGIKVYQLMSDKRKIEFISEFPISDLRPADYNPRLIDEDSFKMLRESIKTFGIIKPVLLNQNGTLVAGHQRIKACIANGIKQVPALRLNQLAFKDEARLNLYHNSIETSQSKVKISGEIQTGYQFVSHSQIEIVERQNPTIIKDICKLILKFGEWGSLIVSSDGNVLFNSDYAVASKTLRKDLLIYVLPREIEAQIIPFLSREYGVYFSENLNHANPNQTKCQMHRLREGEKGKKNSSTCYETLVIPAISKEQRGLDFGEGFGDYRRKLQSEGYQIIGYEPFKKEIGSTEMAMPRIIASIARLAENISQTGLFDYVVLDSVINSVKNLDFEHYVLQTCACLLRSDGKFYMSTRKLGDKRRNKYVDTQRSRGVEFLDKDNFSVTFRDGLWTSQRFHTEESLHETLSRYFAEVEVSVYFKRENQLRAVCSKPRPFSREEITKSLTEEFNPDYFGFKHEKHAKLLQIIVLELKKHGRVY